MLTRRSFRHDALVAACLGSLATSSAGAPTRSSAAYRLSSPSGGRDTGRIVLWFRPPKLGTYMGWVIHLEPAGWPIPIGTDHWMRRVVDVANVGEIPKGILSDSARECDAYVAPEEVRTWHIITCPDRRPRRIVDLGTLGASVQDAEAFAITWIDERRL